MITTTAAPVFVVKLQLKKHDIYSKIPKYIPVSWMGKFDMNILIINGVGYEIVV